MTMYVPIHEDGRTGPIFEFRVLAAAWILEQENPAGWWISLEDSQ